MTDLPILFSAPMVLAILAGTKTQTRRILKADVPPAPAMDAVHPNNMARHSAPYLDSYCSSERTEANPRRMSRNWCWWTRDDRTCLPMFKVRWVPGDRLWVKETFGAFGHWEIRDDEDGDLDEWHFIDLTADRGLSYRFDLTGISGRRVAGEPTWHVRPSLFMPRAASRITLDVTNVRVERLQDITLADELAEGAPIDHSYRDTSRDGSGSPMIRIGPGQWVTPRGWYHRLWDALNGPGAWDANPWVVPIDFKRVA